MSLRKSKTPDIKEIGNDVIKIVPICIQRYKREENVQKYIMQVDE